MKNNIFFFLLFTHVIVGCQAQTIGLNTGWREGNLKGKVKSYVVTYNVLKVPKDDIEYEKLHHNPIWQKNGEFREYTKEGFYYSEKNKRLWPIKKDSLEYNEPHYDFYLPYDLERKRKLKLKGYVPYPAIVSLHIKPHVFTIGQFPNGDIDTVMIAYNYKLNKKKQIIEEEEHLGDSLVNDTITYKPNWIMSKTKYVYNKQGFVSDKIITIIDTAGVSEGEIVEEVGYVRNCKYEFIWDKKNRLQKVSLFDTQSYSDLPEKKLIFEENYTYDNKENYIKEVNRFISPNRTYQFFDTKDQLLYYNKHGDLIYMGMFNSKDDNYRNERFPTDRATEFFFEYKYDNQNNWIECTMYLEAKKPLRPTVVATRAIEYYDETKK